MREILEAVERALPRLLLDEQRWQGKFIDYHPPFVERLWLAWEGDCRVNLHRLLPCESSAALFHPHPWPSIMRVLSGTYEMAVGYGPGQITPPPAAVLTVSGDLIYEMSEKDAWHYVRPVGEPCYSLMISGPPWDRWSPAASKPLSALDEEQRQRIFTFFRTRYPT